MRQPLLVIPRNSIILKLSSRFMLMLTNLNSPLTLVATFLISSVISTSSRVKSRTFGDFSNPWNIVLAFSLLKLIISGSEFLDMKFWMVWGVISLPGKIFKPSSKFFRITTAEFSLTLSWTNQTFISIFRRAFIKMLKLSNKVWFVPQKLEDLHWLCDSEGEEQVVVSKFGEDFSFRTVEIFEKSDHHHIGLRNTKYFHCPGRQTQDQRQQHKMMRNI